MKVDDYFVVTDTDINSVKVKTELWVYIAQKKQSFP